MTYAELKSLCQRSLGLDSDSALSSEESARVERVIKKAIRRIVTARRWMWLTTAWDVEMVAGVDRYKAPWFYGGLMGAAWASDGPRTAIHPIGELDMRRRRQGEPCSGTPDCVTFVRDAQDENGAVIPGYSMLVHPTPDERFVMTLMLLTYPEGMSEDGDRFLAGHFFDRLLEAAIELEACIDRRLEGETQARAADYGAALSDAIRHDDQMRPVRVGRLSKTIRSPFDDDIDSAVLRRPASVIFNGVTIV